MGDAPVHAKLVAAIMETNPSFPDGISKLIVSFLPVYEYVGDVYFCKKTCVKMEIDLENEVRSMWGKTLDDFSHTLEIQIEKYGEKSPNIKFPGNGELEC